MIVVLMSTTGVTICNDLSYLIRNIECCRRLHCTVLQGEAMHLCGYVLLLSANTLRQFEVRHEKAYRQHAEQAA